jgi:DNA-binding NarL/FixJ family response regulator
MIPQVLIAGDRPLIRLGLGAVLANEPLVVCRDTLSVVHLDTHLVHEGADVLLLDLDDLSVPVLPLVARLRALYPLLGLVCVTEGVALVRLLLKAGMDALLTPTEAPDLLLSAVRAAQARQRFLSPSAMDALVGTYIMPGELRVVALLASGHETAQIAQELCITPASVRNYMSRLRQKVGCRGRVQLADWYRRYGAVWPQHSEGRFL